MVRAALVDDPTGFPAVVAVDAVPPPVAYLDGDVRTPAMVEADTTTLLPELTVKVRRRGEPNADGDPTWTWTSVFTDLAVVWTASELLDRTAGVVNVKAKAVVLYAGDVVIDETCAVESNLGGSWRATKVAQLPDRLELWLTRTYQAPSEAE